VATGKLLEKRLRRTRRVWILADTHIGRVEDGKDGDQWLRLAVQDVRKNLAPVDYAVFLGDMTARYEPEQFEKYARLRDTSGILPWYEIAGNHDFHGIENGEYFKWTICPLRYVVLDGNLAWFFVSAERGMADGLVCPQTTEWLGQSIARHQHKNIVVCTHQLVHDTVEYSTREARYLHPKEQLEELLSDVRVDLWLAGHAHFAPRTPAYAANKGHTTFLNVASITHAYNTGASVSYILEMEEGTCSARLRCRIHDRCRFAPEFGLHLKLPQCWHPADPHQIIPAP